MREQLIQYVKLLFAGVPDCEEMQQEILQNTLDRYDDLISQGKTPEAAYRLAISGIGDINEILGNTPDSTAVNAPVFTRVPVEETPEEYSKRKLMRAVAIAFYILCAVPLLILSEFGLSTVGLCFTLLMVAAATALIILSKNPNEEDDDEEDEPENLTPRQKLRKGIESVVWAIGLAFYFIISFLTGAWHITWIIFLIIPCVDNLIGAILDLKEVVNHEN